ncbi:class I SAM-dependent methyltransferase [Bordetella sp. 2513F-2]
MLYRTRQHVAPLLGRFGNAWQQIHEDPRGDATMQRPYAWLSDHLNFYRAWRANPRSIGAVLPSSPALAAAITREIDPARGPVLELGSGTGAFTRALRARGVAEHDLALIEMDPAFARRLEERYPMAQVCQVDAAKLAEATLLDGRQAAAAVCGLPLLNMPLRQQVYILRGTFSHLQPDGACYLFTYGWRCPIPPRVLARLGLRARRIDRVYLNVPPAQVWKLTRRRRWMG